MAIIICLCGLGLDNKLLNNKLSSTTHAITYFGAGYYVNCPYIYFIVVILISKKRPDKIILFLT